jgi:hypothetical protein
VVQCPAGARGFSLPQNVQMGCGTQPFSYWMGTRGFYSRGKVMSMWSWLHCG